MKKRNRISTSLWTLFGGFLLLAKTPLSSPTPTLEKGLPPIATNMCLSLGKKIISNKGEETLRNLNDGRDATVWNAQGPFWVAIQVNATDIEDSDYLMLHYRSGGTGDWNDATHSLNKYKILTSHNSTDGFNGRWKMVKKVKNRRRDRVDVIPNNKPKWIKVVEYSDVSVSLARLDVFRGAPEGYRNDYWIFFGASVIAKDLITGLSEDHSPALFTDLISSFYPDRYPIVINSSRSGELIQYGVKRQRKWVLPENPKATFFAFHHGGNNVSKMRPYPGGKRDLEKGFRALILNAQKRDLIALPSRLTFRNYEEITLPHFPHSEVFGSLPYNEYIIDPIINELTPYAVSPSTGIPYMDPYPWYRDNQDQLSDSVHHDILGAVAMNEMFAVAASRIVYEPLESPLLVYHNNNLMPHFSKDEIPSMKALDLATQSIRKNPDELSLPRLTQVSGLPPFAWVDPEATAVIEVAPDPEEKTPEFVPPEIHISLLEIEYGVRIDSLWPALKLSANY